MIWTIIGVICTAVLVVIGVLQSVRWKVSRHVAGRLRLSEVEFAERFFPAQQRPTAMKLRQLLSPYIPVKTDRIQPSDRLGSDLGLAAGHLRDLDLIAFAQDLEAEFKIEFDEDDDLRMLTFQGLVELVIKKTGVN
jgi:hypothetical protein